MLQLWLFYYREDATMGGRRGCRGAHAGELGVNKKGTPLYSREDIREQYCINDKELQVLDKSQRKSLLGCFSNQGQVIVHQKFHSKLRIMTKYPIKASKYYSKQQRKS